MPKTPEHSKFKKGQSGNPNGRPRKLISETIIELENEGVKETSINEIKGCYLRLVNLSIPELTLLAKNEKQSALVRIVSKAILGGKGFEIIEKILDRSIGKPNQFVDLTSKGEKINTPPPTINVYNVGPPLASNEDDITD
jgi:hypothetical protein